MKDIKDIKEYLNSIEYFQPSRNIYLRIIQPQCLYGMDCCSFASVNLVFPVLFRREFNSISHIIYTNYKRLKDYCKQVKPIKLKDTEDDKWKNK